jgi:hypothetical protein
MDGLVAGSRWVDSGHAFATRHAAATFLLAQGVQH